MIKKELNPEQGKRLKECLKDAHLTQKELADQTGYTPQYISNIIVGRKNMSRESALMFAEKLNVLDKYLLCESRYKTKEEQFDSLRKGITDMATAILSFAEFNGLKITELVLTTDSGKQLVRKSATALSHIFTAKHRLLGTQTIDSEDYYIVDAHYKVKIYGKEYLVDADNIYECFDFVMEYFQIQRSRLYHRLEKQASTIFPSEEKHSS